MPKNKIETQLSKENTNRKQVATLTEGMEEFLKNCKVRNLSPYTLRYYEGLFHVMDLFFDNDNFSISEIDEAFVDFFIFFLQEREIRDTTIASYIKGVRTLLYFFMKKGWVSNFSISVPKADKQLKETYTLGELERLLKKPSLKQCSFVELRSWTMVVYFIGTGQRLRTVLGLKNEDIDLENFVVYIRHIKNRQHTLLPLPSKVVETLNLYMGYRKGNPEDYLFCTWEGLQLTKRGAEEAIKRYNQKRGVEKTSIHLFRHSFAKNYLMAGGDVFRLQRLMCHSSIEITKEYLNLSTEDLSKGLDDLTALKNMGVAKYKTKK